MFRKPDPDVLVVGAGPVGLLAALLIQQRGLAVEIIDADWRTGAHSYALALHPQSLALLDDVDLSGQILQRCHRVTRVAFYEGVARRAELNLEKLPTPHPMLAVLRQDALEGLVEEQLQRRGVRVGWNHRLSSLEVSDDRVRATIDVLGKAAAGYGIATSEWGIERTERVRARFVIGADGRRSRVRTAMGIECATIGEPQSFAVFEFATCGAPQGELRITRSDGRGNVYWPMPDGFCRVGFEIDPSEIPDETRDKQRVAVHIGREAFPFLTPENLETWLRARMPWFEGSIGEVRWSMAVRFERTLADSFGAGRVRLAGDAAHTTGPVGMQSMNVGFREVRELADAIAECRDGSGEPATLVECGKRYREEWRMLLGERGSVSAGPTAPDWLAQHTDRLLECLPVSGEHLSMLAESAGLMLPR